MWDFPCQPRPRRGQTVGRLQGCFGRATGLAQKGRLDWTALDWRGEQEAVSTPLGTPVPREDKHKATATQKPGAELAVSYPFPAQMLCRGHCVSQAAGARALGPWGRRLQDQTRNLSCFPPQWVKVAPPRVRVVKGRGGVLLAL